MSNWQPTLENVDRGAADGEERPWRPALLAAFPHLVFVISTVLPVLFDGNPPPDVLRFFKADYYGFLALMAAAFLLAWRQGWPLWSAGWAGYWLIVPLPLVGDLLPYVAYLAVLLLVGALIFQRRPVYGLLASAPLLLLMTRPFAFELVVGGEWVMAAIWLLLALVTAAIVRAASLRAAVPLMVVFHLLVGLAYALGRSLLPYRGFGLGDSISRDTPELPTLVNDFLPLTLAAVAGLLALLLLRPLDVLATQGGRRARRRHALLLLALLLTLGGVLTLRAGPRLARDLGAGIYLPLAWTAMVVGLLLSLGAALLLARAAQSAGSSRWQAVLAPLLAVFAPLVVFALPWPVVPNGQRAQPFRMVVILSYVGASLWLLFALLVALVPRLDGGVRLRPADAGGAKA